MIQEIVSANNLDRSMPLETDEEVCLQICNLVSKYGDIELTIPVKTWQANIAILSALKNLEKICLGHMATSQKNS